jgi:hypothetical protein
MADAISPIEWPVIKIGPHAFTLRMSYAAYFQLSKWGNPKSDMEWAAAAAGTFDLNGRWHSAGFENSMGLADLVSEQPVEQQSAIVEGIYKALGESIKKAALRPAVSMPPATEKTEAA